MEEHAPASSDAPANFENAITVKEAEERMRAADVPRHEKSIERYCREKQLRGIDQVGGSGEWLIDPNSLEELIVYLRQIHRIKSPRPHAPAGVPALRKENQDNSSEHDRNMLPPAGASSDMRRYVEQLEIRIVEKDKTIDFLQDELKDRRGQIKGMSDFMEQNHGLLATINGNMAPIFKALANVLRPPAGDTRATEASSRIIEPTYPYATDQNGNDPEHNANGETPSTH
jgi:hypothetical protein